jgi:acyl-CoA dehydrogenase
MNSGDPLVRDAAARLFTSLSREISPVSAGPDEWREADWRAVEELGLTYAFNDESTGGFGLSPLDALKLIQLAGFHALPLPLAETMIANRRLGEAGFEPAGGVSVCVVAVDDPMCTFEPHSGGWRLRGRLKRVPWGRQVDRLAVLVAHEDRLLLACLRAGTWSWEAGENIAGFPRDTIDVDASLTLDDVKPAPNGLENYKADEAAIRTLTMAGALDRVLVLCLQHASDRVQFGKPLSKFQVTQQNLAILASHSCATAASADMAAQTLAAGGDVLPIAIAKVRAGEAASIACGIAHQIHGAIGFTAEHRLQRFTRLLWSCRDEGSAESRWSQYIGERVAAGGADALWPLLTAL